MADKRSVNDGNSTVQRGRSPFSRPIDQLGFVVPDLEKAIKGWLELGVGPWFTMGGAVLEDSEYQGKVSVPKIDVALGQSGHLGLELIQPANDESSSYRDFLSAGRQGIQHFGYFAEDFDTAIAAAEAEGQKVLQKGSWGGVHFVYYEMTELIGSQTELIELNDTSREMFAKIREGADAWDGKTDPVRHILSPVMRAGYKLETMVESVQRWMRART